MDDIDRQLLNIIQNDYPITSNPYYVLADRLGITGMEVQDRIKLLINAGIIRKIGAAFNTRKIGHVSVLVAAKVPEDTLGEVAAVVSSFPEVTHNYERDFEYNLWFTLVCENDEYIDSVIDMIKSRTGITDIHELPAEQMFKLKVDLEF